MKINARNIISIKRIPYEGRVYNLNIEEDNSYIANNILVHNCPWGAHMWDRETHVGRNCAHLECLDTAWKTMVRNNDFPKAASKTQSIVKTAKEYLEENVEKPYLAVRTKEGWDVIDKVSSKCIKKLSLDMISLSEEEMFNNSVDESYWESVQSEWLDNTENLEDLFT